MGLGSKTNMNFRQYFECILIYLNTYVSRLFENGSSHKSGSIVINHNALTPTSLEWWRRRGNLWGTSQQPAELLVLCPEKIMVMGYKPSWSWKLSHRTGEVSLWIQAVQAMIFGFASAVRISGNLTVITHHDTMVRESHLFHQSKKAKPSWFPCVDDPNYLVGGLEHDFYFP